MHRHLGLFVLSAALLAPVVTLAQDRDDRREHEGDRDRYYDNGRHEYHQWNEAEQRAWRHYLEERHEHYREWNKASKRQQQEYWAWRHSHPDTAMPPEHERR